MNILGPFAKVVKDAGSTITAKVQTPAPPKKATLRPSLRELERQRSLADEREWEASINAGSEPPRWLPKTKGWLARRWR